MAVSKMKDARSLADSCKYVRYTQEQVQALERLYAECPNPSSFRRLQLLRECPILSKIEPKQIKVWFQNRRCRDKQRKEASRLANLNEKLSAMNRVLVEENESLSKQAIQLVLQNQKIRKQLKQLHCHESSVKLDQNGLSSTENSSDSVVTNIMNHQTLQLPRDAGPLRLAAIAEETLTEFLAKATGTAVEWIQMPGMKPGPDSIGIVAVSDGSNGIAARACGLVGLDPAKIVELLKNRPLWLSDCRRMEVVGTCTSTSGGMVELLYMQFYAPTTLAMPRDFYTLRYTTVLDDCNVVVCERSLPLSHGDPVLPPSDQFVRAKMHSSGYLIRPYGGVGSIVYLVDHMDLQPETVPEVLRPLYESSPVLAQRVTMGAMRYLRTVAHDVDGDSSPVRGLQPAVIRTLTQRMARGFNEAINCLSDDGWSSMPSDGMDDVTIAVNTYPVSRMSQGQFLFCDRLPAASDGVLCAKTSMLLQNVPPALLIRFLREHRSEWADLEVCTDIAASLGHAPLASRRGVSCYGSAPLLLSHSPEQRELLELLQMDSPTVFQDGGFYAKDNFLLQLCTGLDEASVGASAQLVFAPVSVSVSEDMPLVSSGFRVVPLDSSLANEHEMARTLDLASVLESGGRIISPSADKGPTCPMRSVLTIAFQFPCEIQTFECVATLARKYVRTVVASVLRVAMALASNLSPPADLKQTPGTPELLILVQRMLQSYESHFGIELLKGHSESIDTLFKLLWHLPDAILCCIVKASPELIFANQSGLDMLETSSNELQTLDWQKMLDENERKSFCTELDEVLQRGFAYLPRGVRISATGRVATFERGVAWKVHSEMPECLAYMFVKWSF
uniref:Class III homeodomain-leucine zipper protein n=1 Tax=Ceratopteris pteridoides TaxID=58167 RepID=A0A2S1CVL8_9MONI|nr:class III homeodomain-leucine zipper protein [Ceratopteris pteridoides]